MNLDLGGKSVLVTGSSRGIGRAISETLYAEGCRVALNGRIAADVMLASSKLPGSIAVVGDVTKPDEATRIVHEVEEAFGSLDILVANVGGGSSVPPGEENFAEWQRVFELNFLSATNAIEAARSALAKNKGVIICISSICGAEVINGAPITYSAIKAALNAYVRGIARPLGRLGIRINAVAPGNILFDGSVWSHKIQASTSSVSDFLERDVALARLGEPKEVADLVAYLASPRSSFATGAVWTLDGGQIRS
ncbi:SDR family oxidoreductase [Polynucleobacter paneuropaeus]|jgi:NAD(P)-dependent dehydrogenase (short-subunit alcohol dehydrogenase family)|nr:SDR family oxidoreductase [Polynucleobacter paneuropaeus]